MSNLCNRTDVKTFLGLNGTAHDAAIDRLLPAASDAVERHCRQRFVVTTQTEYYDGGGSNRIALRRRPVTGVTGVWDDPDRDFSDEALVLPEEYEVDGESGLLWLKRGSFFAGTRNVKVTYQAGFATVPASVEQAVVALVAHWFRAGRESGAALPDAVAALLAPFQELAA